MAAQTSSYTRTTYLDLVRGGLGVRSQNFATDADIIAFGDDGAKEIARLTHWLRKSTSSNVTSSTATYDLPTDAISIDEVYHNDLRLQPASIRQIERWHPTENWRTLTGTPTHYYLNGMTSVGLYLTPDTSITNGLVIYHSYFPAALSSGSDHYTVPTALDRVLVDYGMLQVAIKDGSGELGRMVPYLQQQWEQGIADIRALVGEVSGEDLLVIGEDNDPLDNWAVYNPIYRADIN